MYQLRPLPTSEGEAWGSPGRYPISALGSEAYLYVPQRKPAPLLVMLHGAGGTIQSWDRILRHLPRVGYAVLAPQSKGKTWLRADPRGLEELIHLALRGPFRLHCLAGFSDGATTALSLGLANGDQVPRILACSPGGLRLSAPVGKPRVMITHGSLDTRLPARRCGRAVQARLRQLGYPTTYREFLGGHTISPAVLPSILRWLRT